MPVVSRKGHPFHMPLRLNQNSEWYMIYYSESALLLRVAFPPGLAYTHHSEGPRVCAVHGQPCLLLEPDQAPLSLDAIHPRKRIQDVFHDSHAETREYDNPEPHKREVVDTATILLVVRVIVGKVEELRSPPPRAGEENMCQRKEEDEINGETWSNC